MTSNLGSAMILESHSKDDEKLKDALFAELRRHFRPEFLNRIDETLVFHALNKNEIRRIVSLQLAKLSKRLEDNGITLDVDDSACDLIADAGFDPDFGARPLKRAVIRLLETPLSRKLIAGDILPGSSVKVSAENGELIFK